MKENRSFTIDSDIAGYLDKKCELENRNFSNMVELFVMQGLGLKPKLKAKKAKVEEHPRFQEFWNLYDKKLDCAKCKDKFSRLDEETINLIFEKLPFYIQSTPDKKFRKNPMTWLNGQCWNDEVQLNVVTLQHDSVVQQSNNSNWHEEDLGL